MSQTKATKIKEFTSENAKQMKNKLVTRQHPCKSPVLDSLPLWHRDTKRAKSY